MKTIISENAINTTITKSTSLGELLAIIGPVTKADKIPSAKKLREETGEPVAIVGDCCVYANGYAVYANGSGRTVVWLPDCVSFTYRFNKLKDGEQVGDLKERETLLEGLLESQPWLISVTLIGEHRIENRSFHHKIDRRESKSLIRGDNEEGDALDEQAGREDRLQKEYSWLEDRFGENPETVYIHKETQEEMLKVLTEKQKDVFLRYFRDGYTQMQIAEILGIDRSSVRSRLICALKKVKKNLTDTTIFSSPTALYKRA